MKFDGVDDWLRHTPSSEWAFFHQNDCAAFLACRIGVIDNPNTYYPLFCTGSISSSIVGADLWWDDRAASSMSDALRYSNATGSANIAVIDFKDSVIANRFSIVSALMSPGNATLVNKCLYYANGAKALVTSSAGTGGAPSASNPSNMTIGGQANLGKLLDGTISELIIYPRDMTAERQLVEGNMAWYY